MTKLEEEIWVEICQQGENRLEDNTLMYTEEDKAKAAAKVAKRYIEMAFKDGAAYGADPCDKRGTDEATQQWLKENGITE